MKQAASHRSPKFSALQPFPGGMNDKQVFESNVIFKRHQNLFLKVHLFCRKSVGRERKRDTERERGRERGRERRESIRRRRERETERERERG